MAYCCQLYMGQATLTGDGLRWLLAHGYEIGEIAAPEVIEGPEDDREERPAKMRRRVKKDR
jgi:hypothetical protein